MRLRYRRNIYLYPGDNYRCIMPLCAIDYFYILCGEFLLYLTMNPLMLKAMVLLYMHRAQIYCIKRVGSFTQSSPLRFYSYF